MKKSLIIILILIGIVSIYAMKEINPVDPITRYTHDDPTDNDDYSELWVDDDYDSGTAGWGETHHDNIQDAIDRAVKISIDYSATEEPAGIPIINVAPGEYMGCYLTKPVKIHGNAVDRPVINDGTMDHLGVKANADVGTMPTAFNCNDASKTVNAHFSEIKNFIIEFPRTGVNESDSRLPIYLKNVNYVEIANCDISYCNQSITIWGCAHADIHDNIINYPMVGGAINGGGIGIWIGSSHTGLLCQYNEIYNNTVNGSAPGDYTFSVNGIAGGADYRYAPNWDVEQSFAYNKFYDNVVLGTYEPDARCFEFALLYDSSPAIPFTTYPTEITDPYYDNHWDDMFGNEVYGNLFDGTHDPVYMKYGWQNKFYNNTVYSTEYGLSISQDQVDMYCRSNNITSEYYSFILYDSATRNVDATLNYFGTMDSTAIEETIYHNGENDGGAGSGVVTYFPALEKRVLYFDIVDAGTSTNIGTTEIGEELYLAVEDSDIGSENIESYIIGNPNNNASEVTISANDYWLSPVYYGVNPSATLSFDIDVYFNRLDQMLNYTGNFSLVSRTWDDQNDVWGDWAIESSAVKSGNSFGLNIANLNQVKEFAVVVQNLSADIIEENLTFTPGVTDEISFNWNTGSAVGVNYEVYASDDPFDDLDNWTLKQSSTRTDFTYELGENEDYLFFTVVIDDDNNTDPSEIVGYFKYQCSTEATTNINLISLPLLPVDPDTEDAFMASEFIETYIGTENCNTISYWDRYTQSWITASYVDGLGWGGDFVVEANEAYMIGVTQDFEVTIYGTLPNAPEGYLVISETTNANMVMLPLNEMAKADNGDGTLTITEVGNEICGSDGSVDQIAYWNNTNQYWQSISDFGDNWQIPDYEMKIGVPYMFFSTEYVEWPSAE